jgi:polysaccharide biosynthesis protein PelG
MAGIGFELRKVIGKGGIGTFIKAAVSGIMIVAGPWILSVIGINIISTFMTPILGDMPYFRGVIIYCYAWSLFLFGGFHFLYTRIMADLLFVKKTDEAAGALVFFALFAFLISGAISVTAVFTFKLDFEYPNLFRAAAILLMTTVNVLWLIMIFISLLRWYGRILFVYTGGMAVALILVYLLGRAYGTSGALLGFALGHLLIVVLLGVLAFAENKPKSVFSNGRVFISYVKKHTLLFMTGFFYYWGIWIDKMVFWITRGEAIPGTFITLFADYDVAVYLANLTMIPGLVYFIIVSETEFYVLIRKFLVSLSSRTFTEIQKRKQNMLGGMYRGIRNQSLFQAMFTISLILFVPIFSRTAIGGLVEPIVLQITLIGVFFHLLFLTLMNYLFYMEFYLQACMTCFIFTAANAALAVISSLELIPFIPGASYCAAGILAAVYALSALGKRGKRLDRKILAEAAGV